MTTTNENFEKMMEQKGFSESSNDCQDCGTDVGPFGIHRPHIGLTLCEECAAKRPGFLEREWE